MTIEQLLGHTTEELAAMSDEELLAKYAEVFKLEPKSPEDFQVIKPKKASKPKTKMTEKERMKAKLEELNKQFEEDEDE